MKQTKKKKERLVTNIIYRQISLIDVWWLDNYVFVVSNGYWPSYRPLTAKHAQFFTTRAETKRIPLLEQFETFPHFVRVPKIGILR